MAAPRPAKPVTLLYGNQAYSVEQAAGALIDRILGEGPRDFSLYRFDAEEMLRAGAPEGAGSAVDALQLACDTPPFLSETWVVRVDHVEAVRAADRAAQTLQRALGELRVARCTLDGEACWALEDDLLPDERGAELVPVQRWVRDVEGRGSAPPKLHLAAAGDEAPSFVVAQGGERWRVDLKGFLRERLRGRFVFADEADEEDAAAPAGSAAGRLHQLLERLVEHTPPGLHLVLTAAAGRESDLSRGLLGKVKRHGAVERFVTYDDYNPADWVLREARARGLRLDRPRAGLIVHLVGNDLGRLASELDKLALAFGEGGSPDEDALLQAVHGGQGGSLFVITERLGSKDLAGALTVLEHFLADNPNEHPVLIGILARYFRQLLQVHALDATGGAGEAELAAQLKLHPFIAKKVAAQARRFEQVELERIVRALAGLDVAVKRHGRLEGPLFRELVHATCAGAFRRADHPLGTPLLGRA